MKLVIVGKILFITEQKKNIFLQNLKLVCHCGAHFVVKCNYIGGREINKRRKKKQFPPKFESCIHGDDFDGKLCSIGRFFIMSNFGDFL